MMLSAIQVKPVSDVLQYLAVALENARQRRRLPFTHGLDRHFWSGFRAALPFDLGVAAFGIVFGALAVSNGLPPLAAIGMSIFVFAGSSQFVAAELVGGGASALVIILVTFLINLRHLLYSASLHGPFGPLRPTWKWLLAYPIIDENFGLAMIHQRRGELPSGKFGWFFAGISTNLIIVWWSATAVGATAGSVVPANLVDLLGFTAPLMLTSLVISMAANRPELLVAISAALARILLNPLPHKMSLLAAAGIGIVVGVLVDGRRATSEKKVEASRS
jgi:4-azaleucine resistance transporter AzlC